jgi:hypothetical protein
MIDYKICRNILQEDGKALTDQEVIEIADLLWRYAEITFDYNTQTSNNGSSKKTSNFIFQG